jgi:DNA sulfur modification protein DndC
MRSIELISEDELHEIRRIWVFEKHEIEDSLPRIYTTVTGETFPGTSLDEHIILGADDVEILREICGDDDLHFEMTRSLIAVERRYRTMARRAKLFETLEKTIRRSFYDGQEDAEARARTLGSVRDLKTGAARATSLQPAHLGAPQDAVSFQGDLLEDSDETD